MLRVQKLYFPSERMIYLFSKCNCSSTSTPANTSKNDLKSEIPTNKEIRTNRRNEIADIQRFFDRFRTHERYVEIDIDYDPQERALEQFEKQEYSDKEMEKERENEIRDISGLSPYHKAVMNRKPLPVPMSRHDAEKESLAALKHRYIQFGWKSGVNPAILWPSRADEAEQLALETHPEYPDPDMNRDLNSALKRVAKAEKLKERKRLARIAEVDKNIEDYPKVFAQYHEETSTKEAEISEIERKKDANIREIQEYFGYAVDPSDPRFIKMMEQKEAEEKKAEKAAKRKEKEMKTIASLQ